MARPIVLFAVDRAGVVTLSEGEELTAFGLQVGQVVDRSVFDTFRGHAAGAHRGGVHGVGAGGLYAHMIAEYQLEQSVDAARRAA